MTARTFFVTLTSGRRARVILVTAEPDPEEVRAALGLPTLGGSIVVVGGALEFDAPEFDSARSQVRALFDALVPFAEQNRITLIDGGTPYGIMRLLGEARASYSGSFPLIGVAPADKVGWTEESPETTLSTLDPHHTAFVLTPGKDWGAEAELMARLSHVLAQLHPRLEVLVNGGPISRRDIIAYLGLRGRVVVIGGSGRFADELASAVETGQHPDPDIQDIAIEGRGRIHVFPISEPPSAFIDLLREVGGW